jgi:hypothetical protein
MGLIDPSWKHVNLHCKPILTAVWNRVWPEKFTAASLTATPDQWSIACVWLLNAYSYH